MGEDLTWAIFVGVMSVGGLVWLWSLQLALRMGRATEPADWPTAEDLADRHFAVESGSRTVRGDPEKLSAALARLLLQPSVGMFSSLFEITERTADRIVLKKTGPLVCNQPAGTYFSEAVITFEDLRNNMVRVSYLLDYERLARRLRTFALGFILGIGLPVIVIVGTVVWLIVLPSHDPAVRWQVIQTLQIAHALWPPFLIIGLYTLGRRQSKTYFSNLLSTLELAA